MPQPELSLSVFLAERRRCRDTGGSVVPEAARADGLSFTAQIAGRRVTRRAVRVRLVGVELHSDRRLRLLPQDSSLRQLTFPGGMRDTGTTVPLYGTAEIDMSPVDAVYAGDLSSVDPTRPGVVVGEGKKESSPARIVS